MLKKYLLKEYINITPTFKDLTIFLMENKKSMWSFPFKTPNKHGTDFTYREPSLG